MTKILKLPEFAKDDGVAQMKIGAAGVATEFDTERFLGFDGPFNFSGEVVFRDDLLGASFDEVHLFVD